MDDAGGGGDGGERLTGLKFGSGGSERGFGAVERLL
jgi:hypothetical protein